MLKVQNMMDIKEVLLQWVIDFFDKISSSANALATCAGSETLVMGNKFAGGTLKVI